MFDVVALGELLIDFTPCGISEEGRSLFEQNPGGAPANVLAAIAKLGGKTAFIGKVGDDIHGLYLRDVLQTLNINTDHLLKDPNYFTTLAFVTLRDGERSFSFARKPGADMQLTASEIDPELLRQTKVFHFGSLSLTNEPVRSATYEAIEMARTAGTRISYDPNYRAPLWADSETAVREMRGVIPFVDIMKISDEECGLITGETDPDHAADALIDMGVQCVFVTLGSDGALIKTKKIRAFEPSAICHVVDTTGAGDSFWGAVLYQFVKNDWEPEDLNLRKARMLLRFANATAGLCVQKRGAIPAMPSLEEVEEMIELQRNRRMKTSR